MQHPTYESRALVDFLPGWARVADLATVMLVGASATIAMSGGFRMKVGTWHVAMTSPARIALWAVAIAAIRHGVVRRHSILSHVSARVVRMVRSESLRTSAGVTAVTCPLIWLIGFLALSTIGYAPGASPFHDFSSELVNLPLRWDAGWYLQIAVNGYQFVRDAEPQLQQNVVFFPAYPMLVRLIALVCGNSMGAYVFAGVFASLAFFAIGLAYLYRIARTVLDVEQSTATLWLMATYPFALFFGAIYAESLYFAASAGAFLHVRRREWWPAALWAFVAGATRPPGFLLCVPLAIAVFEDARNSGDWSGRAIAVTLAPLAAVACYSAFVWQLAGSPIAWATGHAAWGRHYRGVSQIVTDRYNFIASAGLRAYVAEQPFDLLNALGLVFSLVSLIPLARRFSIALAAFVVINVLPGALTGGMLSMGRFSSVAFPAFLWLAAATPARHRPAWMTAFASLQALNATLFYTWRPLF